MNEILRLFACTVIDTPASHYHDRRGMPVRDWHLPTPGVSVVGLDRCWLVKVRTDARGDAEKMLERSEHAGLCMVGGGQRWYLVAYDDTSAFIADVRRLRESERDT